MTLRWWQWKHIEERLKLWGRALQGVEPYRIEFSDEPGLTGLTNFTTRLIKVNPEISGGSNRERGTRSRRPCSATRPDIVVSRRMRN